MKISGTPWRGVIASPRRDLSHNIGAEASGLWEWIALLVLMAFGAGTIAFFGRGWSFFYDEWGVIEYRRSGGPSAFFAPLNGHLLALPIAIYRVMFATVGISSYWPYRSLIIAAHIGLVALLYAYLRRKVPAIFALFGVALILFLGAAWEVLFWMMNLGFVLPLMAFLGYLLISDLIPDQRWEGPSFAGLATLALASSGLGLAVTAGMVADLALKRRWRDAIWLLGPLAAFLTWFIGYRPHASTPGVLRAIPGANPSGDVGALGTGHAGIHKFAAFVWHVAESSASGLVGSSVGHWYWICLLAATIMGGILVGRGVPTRLITVGVALGTFWGSLALVRSGANPGASRYVYPGAVFLVLAAAEAWSPAGRSFAGLRGPKFRSVAVGRILVGVLGIAVVTAVSFGIRTLNDVGTTATAEMHREHAELAKIECPNSRIAPTYNPDRVAMPGLVAGPYLAAIRALGSPVSAQTVERVCHLTDP